jgi:hypothetical protein
MDTQMPISQTQLQKQQYRKIEHKLAIKRVLLAHCLINACSFSASSTDAAIDHMLKTGEIKPNTSTDDEIVVAFMELSAFYNGLDNNDG